MRSAGGSGAPGGANTSRTPGSARSGSKSSKLAICGRRGNDDDVALAGRRGEPVERDGVLGRQARGVGEMRHEAERRPAAQRLDRAHPVVEQRGIAAKLVDEEAARPAPRRPASSTARVPTIWAMTPPRSMSPISTTGTSAARAKPMLAMSFVAQIDLRRAARALDQHEVGLARCSLRETLEHARQQLRLPAPDTRAPSRRRRPGPARRPGEPISLCGFSSTGFIWTLGSTPQARACNACARPISPPSAVTAALLDMFCGLNGAPEGRAASARGRARRRSATCRRRSPCPETSARAPSCPAAYSAALTASQAAAPVSNCSRASRA